MTSLSGLLWLPLQPPGEPPPNLLLMMMPLSQHMLYGLGEEWDFCSFSCPMTFSWVFWSDKTYTSTVSASFSVSSDFWQGNRGMSTLLSIRHGFFQVSKGHSRSTFTPFPIVIVRVLTLCTEKVLWSRYIFVYPVLHSGLDLKLSKSHPRSAPLVPAHTYQLIHSTLWMYRVLPPWSGPACSQLDYISISFWVSAWQERWRVCPDIRPWTMVSGLSPFLTWAVTSAMIHMSLELCSSKN